MVPLRRPALLGAGVLAAPRRPARQTIVYVFGMNETVAICDMTNCKYYQTGCSG